MLAVRPAEVYRRAAKKAGLDSDLMASVGEAVFTELVECMSAPKKLAYELDHVGTFAVRHKNFWVMKRRMDRRTPDRNKDFPNRWAAVPALIDEYQAKKQAFKQTKHEYNSRKES